MTTTIAKKKKDQKQKKEQEQKPQLLALTWSLTPALLTPPKVKPVFTILGLQKIEPRRQNKKSEDNTLVGILRKFIREKRIEELEANPDLINDNEWWLTQQDIIYLIRPDIVAAGLKIHEGFGRKNLTSMIAKVCKEFGYTREQLGIITAGRALLYFNGEVKAVGLDDLEDLAKLGICILFIEKEGMAEQLAPYANKVGVAIIHSRGFFVDYAEKLGILAHKYGAHVFFVTDFDVSGLLMALKSHFVIANPGCRIGVDFQTLEELDISREQVEEEYDAYRINKKTGERRPNNHYASLLSGEIEFESAAGDEYLLKVFIDPETLAYLGQKRIEINWVKKAVGNERFWNWIQARMERELKRKKAKNDYTRAADIPDHLEPNEYENLLTQVDGVLDNVTQATNDHIKNQLKAIDGFLQMESVQQQIYDKQSETILANQKVKDIMKALQKVSDEGKKRGWWLP
jgi:hypothetical protein